MLIYQGTKTNFMYGMEEDSLPREVENLIYEKMNRTTSSSEYKSWENSLQYIYKVLNDKDIPSNSGVAIEYNIPLTRKRVDFILLGLNKNETNTAVVV